jgi:aminoglycoside phosphotransferase (APT) family kinase protein
MTVEPEVLNELFDKLVKLHPGEERYEIKDGGSIIGGADTKIDKFDFSFYSNNEKIVLPLIIRIFREKQFNRAEKEFKDLEKLYQANLSVPKPYYWKYNEKIGKYYMVMERIEGQTLDKYLFSSDDETSPIYIHKFIQELVNIHSFDWKNNEIIQNKYIQKDLHTKILLQIETVRRIVDDHEIDEFYPLLDWLKANIRKIENPELVLIHGDYHPQNCIVDVDGSLVIIDWSNLQIHDYRVDLGFLLVMLNSFAQRDYKQLLLVQYEKLSGRMVKSIDYFMVLSNLFNLLRIYSTLIDPSITNENEETKKVFTGIAKPYSLYLVGMIRSLTGVNMDQLSSELYKF